MTLNSYSAENIIYLKQWKLTGSVSPHGSGGREGRGEHGSEEGGAAGEEDEEGEGQSAEEDAAGYRAGAEERGSSVCLHVRRISPQALSTHS